MFSSGFLILKDRELNLFSAFYAFSCPLIGLLLPFGKNRVKVGSYQPTLIKAPSVLSFTKNLPTFYRIRLKQDSRLDTPYSGAIQSFVTFRYVLFTSMTARQYASITHKPATRTTDKVPYDILKNAEI